MRTLWCLVLIGVSAAPTAGQISGRVVDATTGDPVPEAGVVLLDSLGAVQAQTVVGTNGGFTVEPVTGPGRYTLQVLALGYVGSAEQTVSYSGDGIFLDIAMEPAPVEVEGITVSVETRDLALEANGFYRRRQAGMGDFVSPEDLEGRVMVNSIDLVRRLPSVQVRGFSEPIFTRNQGGIGGSAGCVPDVWVDDVPVRQGGTRGGINSFGNVVPPPELVHAVEAYPGGSTVPPQYRTLTSICGVIVVWTKRN